VQMEQHAVGSHKGCVAGIPHVKKLLHELHQGCENVYSYWPTHLSTTWSCTPESAHWCMQVTAAFAAHKSLESLTLIGYPNMIVSAVAEGIRRCHTLRSLKITRSTDARIDAEDSALTTATNKAVARMLESNISLESVSLPVDVGKWVGRILAQKLKRNTKLKALELTAGSHFSHAGAMDDRTGAALAHALRCNTHLTSLSLKFPANLSHQKGQAVGYNGTAMAMASMLKVNTTLTTLKLKLAPLTSNAEQVLLDALAHSKTLSSVEATKEFNGSDLLSRPFPFKSLSATVSVDAIAAFTATHRLQSGINQHEKLDLNIFVTSAQKAEVLAQAIPQQIPVHSLHLGFRFNVEPGTVLPVLEALSSPEHGIETLRLDLWPKAESQQVICEGIARMIQRSTSLRHLTVQFPGQDKEFETMLSALARNTSLRSFHIESPPVTWPRSLDLLPLTGAAVDKVMAANVTCCSLRIGKWQSIRSLRAAREAAARQENHDEDSDSDSEGEEEPFIEPECGDSDDESASRHKAVKEWMQRNRDLPLQAHAVAQLARQIPVPTAQRAVAAMGGPAGFSDTVMAFLYPAQASLHLHPVWKHLDEPAKKMVPCNEAQEVASEAEPEDEEAICTLDVANPFAGGEPLFRRALTN